MAAADTMFESLQRLQSMMESFDESLSQLCKDNSSESALELWKILLKYYYDLQKALQSRYETLNIKKEKPEEPETRGKSKENETLKVNGLNPASSSISKVLLSVEVRPEIKALCDKADGRGLKNYIVDNMNEGETLRNELLVALSKAPDAAKLVIKALEDCDLSKNDYSERKMGEPSVSSVDGEACRLLLESLYPVFGNDNGHIVPPDVKYSAQVIANEWGIKILGRSKKMRKDVSSANKSDLHVFLQLVATFRLAAGYCMSRLCTYFSAIIPGKRTPELCRSLGLSSKIPNLGKGDPALALRCAHVAGLMDKIDPVNLLTSYLSREEKRAKAVLTKGHGSADSQDAANLKMVHALENVIILSKEYGLRSHFCEDDLQKKLTILVQEKETLIKKRIENPQAKKVKLLRSYLGREQCRAKDILTNGLGSAVSQDAANLKMVHALENVIKLIKEYGLQSHFCEDDLQKKLTILVQEKETLIEKRNEDAQEKKDTEKDAKEKAQEEIDRKKAAEKKAQEEEDRKKAVEKKAQEEENRKKATEKKAQEGIDRKKAVEEKAHEEEDRKKATEKKAQEKEDREKATEKKAQEEKDRKNAAEKKAQEKEDREKAAEKKAKETEDRKKAAENSLQHKRRQSFEPGFGPSERENYASKRAKHASPNVTTRVAGGMGNSKASHYNINGVQKNSGLIGHDHHTSPFSAANRSSTGAAAGGFTSTPSIAAAQINDERRRLPSAFGTSNLTPIGSSFYGSSAPAGAFAVPLYNVAEINYEGRGQQCYTMNLGEVDKNHVRASVYETGDLAKSSATQSNYNYEGRSQQSYKLNFVEVDNVPVSTSTYGTGVLANSSATQAHYERRGPEMYTSAFGGGNTASIGSSVYGSNSRTIPLSDVNQGGHERSLGQYLGFASRNMVPIESSGYGPDVSRVPSSNVTQGHFESKRAVIDKYRFNSGSSLL